METSTSPTPTDIPHLDKARLAAEINLSLAQEELSRRLLDPTISTKNLLDIAEHSYKVSGMAAKNTAKEAQQGAGFSITINIPQVGGTPAQSLVIGSSSADDDIDALDLPAIPAFLAQGGEGNLTPIALANE